MLGMVGHVPGQEAYRRGGQQGAGIEQHIAIPLSTAGVLSQQISTKKRRADRKRQQHIRNKPAASRQKRQHHKIASQHPARLPRHGASHHLRDICILPPAAGIAKKHADIRQPEGDAAQIPQITAWP